MLDMLIVMLVPLLVRNLFPIINDWVQAVWNADRSNKKAYERIIEYKKNYEYCEFAMREPKRVVAMRHDSMSVM